MEAYIDPTTCRNHLKYWNAIVDLKAENGIRLLKHEHNQHVYLDSFSSAALIDNINRRIISLYGALEFMIYRRLLTSHFNAWKQYLPYFEYRFYEPRYRAKLMTIFTRWKFYTENSILEKKSRISGTVIICTLLGHKYRQLIQNSFITWLEYRNRQKKLLIKLFHAWSTWTSKMILTKLNVVHILQRAEYYHKNYKKRKCQESLHQWSIFTCWKKKLEILKLMWKRWKMLIYMTKTRLRLFTSYWTRWYRTYVNYKLRIEVSHLILRISFPFFLCQIYIYVYNII